MSLVSIRLFRFTILGVFKTEMLYSKPPCSDRNSNKTQTSVKVTTQGNFSRSNGSCNSRVVTKIIATKRRPQWILLSATMSVTRLTTISAIARGVKRCNGSCSNSSRNDFNHCTGCYTLQWLVQQLVSQ